MSEKSSLKSLSCVVSPHLPRLGNGALHQVLDVFKHFHALVERLSGEILKCIRTDNGGEY